MSELKVDPRVALLLLAAGKGERFGEAKQLAEIEGEPMLRKVVRAVYAPVWYRVIVVTGAYGENIRELLTGLDIDIVDNPEWRMGMSTSIQKGLQYVQEHLPGVTGILIALGDQWKLQSGDLQKLLEQPDQITATQYPEGAGVPAYFPKQAWPRLDKLSGDQGAKELLRSLKDIRLMRLGEATDDLDYPL